MRLWRVILLFGFISRKGKIMPFIAFESGQLSDEVKQQLIEKLTQVSVEVTGIPKELFLVSIREQPDNSIAVGGRSVEQIKQDLAQSGS